MASEGSSGQGYLDEKPTQGDKVVKRWLDEIHLSEVAEKDWREDSLNALKIYNGYDWLDQTHDKKKKTFNILWSNVETKRPALYNQLPRPDIRRRFKDQDKLGKVISELMERCISFTIENDFDEEVIAAVNDMLLPGRAVTKVKYVPTFEGEVEEDEEGNEVDNREVAYQEVVFEQVQWDDYRRGPAKRWKDVPWQAFRHKMRKDEFEKRWPQMVDQVTYTETSSSDDKEGENKRGQKKDKSDDSVFKKTMVWEIWDKDERKVIFISTSYKDQPLEVQDDPMGLKDFWPNPRPLYAIEDPSSLIPNVEYSMYETLAKELELMTNRINKIIDGLRLRGIYDPTIAEMQKLFDGQDNAFEPAENLSRIIEAGGIDKAIWMLPIVEMAQVLNYLYERRQSLVQEIYEITGISDIQRGATDPNETLGAQQLKANFGSGRLQKQQREVQRYVRDLIRIGVEIIAENFSPEVMSLMSGLKYPSAEEKQMAQLGLEQAQQANAPPPSQLVQVLQSPSWDEIMEVLHSDMLREYRIDIETDSTIQPNEAEDKKAITELLTSMVQFMGGVGPAVQAGAVDIQLAKSLLTSAVRRFRLGREVEDAIEEMEQRQQGQQQQPDPQQQAQQQQQQAAQQQQQVEQQKAQMELQSKQQEMQWRQQEYELEMQDKQAERKVTQAEHAMKMEEIEMKRLQNQADHQRKMAEATVVPIR
ncbi:MAG: hypothetical protein CL963_03490 [Euryarchaeota archaeon]|nr:hypothetical protein [Euryarchaeota archaeon]